MAAIDKLYVTYNEYLKFKDWCWKQPMLVDKYGKRVRITEYLYRWENSYEGERPVIMAPYYVDAYLIRNCPLQSIQDELSIRYDVEKVKNNELYKDPEIPCDFKVGKHFKCIKYPQFKVNRPFGTKKWWVQIYCDEIPYPTYNADHNTWDSIYDFVASNGGNTAFFNSIKAIKRSIIKWKLPVNTVIEVTGRYIEDTYKFIVTI